MMTLDEALTALRARGDEEHAAAAAASHKVPRTYLGVPNPVLDELARTWRQSMALEDRLALASELWASDIHEARISAAKLLTQARIRPDDAEVWALICSWVPDCDAWAVADHVCMAGQRRIMADLSRLDEVEAWTTEEDLGTKRAALVMTLGLTRMNHPSEAEAAARARVLGWAADYVTDKRWFIQKAIAVWLGDLSKHDPEAVTAFLVEYGAQMSAFALKEASKKLPTLPELKPAPVPPAAEAEGETDVEAAAESAEAMPEGTPEATPDADTRD